MCSTEVESNLLAMGFEVTSDSVVAHLPDSPPSSLQPSSVKKHTTQQQVPMKSKDSTPLSPAAAPLNQATACKPTIPSVRTGKADSAVERDAHISVVAADGSQQSLYQIIRQRSQHKLSTQHEQSAALSSDVEDPPLNQNSESDGTQLPQREPSVKFCLENNAFISASSAEESQCR